MKRLLVVVAMLALMPLAVRADDALVRAHLAASDGEWREALAWFEIAAENGDVQAKEVVASMYLNGAELYPGIERNVALAKAWYYRAGAQGSTIARGMLAQLERFQDGAPSPAVAAAAETAPVH